MLFPFKEKRNKIREVKLQIKITELVSSRAEMEIIAFTTIKYMRVCACAHIHTHSSPHPKWYSIVEKSIRQ